MKSANELIVTTTQTIQGYDIVKYYGIVSSHVVAGTNIFSDIFASFSDVFGGRSSSYQKQISSINKEAIDLLKHKITAMGANAIVGLSIDHDEISGKGKSMFMVTALGTAVLIEQNVEKTKIKSVNAMGTIDIEQVEISLTINHYLELINNKQFLFKTNDFWDFIYDQNPIEFLSYIIENTSKEYDYNADSWTIEKAIEYLRNLPRELLIAHIYSELNNNNNPTDFILFIIDTLTLADFGLIHELLQSEDLIVKQNGLEALKSHKLYYNENDLEQLEVILDNIDNYFQEKTPEFDIVKELLVERYNVLNNYFK